MSDQARYEVWDKDMHEKQSSYKIKGPKFNQTRARKHSVTRTPYNVSVIVTCKNKVNILFAFHKRLLIYMYSKLDL